MATIATLRDLIEALVESAKEEGKLDKVISDLERFFELLHSEELRNILGSSVFGARERQAVVKDIGEKADFDRLTVNFLDLAVELDKFKALLGSQETFMRKLRKASGRVKAEVIIASEPREEDIQRIKESLKKLVEGDIEISVKVDPSILGGVIAKVEDKVFDGSVKTQLEKMRGFLFGA
ncbi:MAG TPA: ATP synthase F1 subunit delta [Thermodesulfobacteriota bacterium]|nr:ATP synthase F1 subunit delta [Thermodesulfobacteriota bacterium]